MNIVFTGDYSADYNRTNIILKGLQNMPDISVVEYPVKSKNIPF
jgi:hypothetical protein